MIDHGKNLVRSLFVLIFFFFRILGTQGVGRVVLKLAAAARRP